MFKKIIFVLAMCLSQLSFAFYGEKTPDQLEAIFLSGNEALISQTLNEVRSGVYEQSHVEIIIKAFNEKYEAFSKEKKLKLMAGNILLQANRNKFKINEDLIKEIKHETINHALDGDIDQVHEALMSLSIIDDDDSFEKLLQIARMENPRTFRAAILGLVSSCRSFSSSKFDLLVEHLSESKKHEAQEIREKFRSDVGDLICKK